eukprot:CAMPEP_0168611548 /NCGR_PEP_ID=MMETSP0449_2-20121227/2418_1 /TAXON_ID=1082188 /ORGANISM="Strombidium rassoulzadegani, Strain ras09" /LENGTH=229 /DNA_ID=CAMNT_0008652005 /DNA_START=252 /DNA_END=938 /DNA_ORIENTATION=-
MITALYFLYQLYLIIFKVKIMPEGVTSPSSGETPDHRASMSLGGAGYYDEFHNEESKVLQVAGCLGIICCTTASTIFHLYNPISERVAEMTLRLDLIGIGVMIFTLTLTLVYVGFHEHVWEQRAIMTVMLLIGAINGIAQMTPCYAQDKYNNHRVVFYTLVVTICFGLALSWFLFYASEKEMKLFAVRLIMSFVYLGIGFAFYISKYPERLFPDSRLVQIGMQSHIWWH